MLLDSAVELVPEVSVLLALEVSLKKELVLSVVLRADVLLYPADDELAWLVMELVGIPVVLEADVTDVVN